MNATRVFALAQTRMFFLLKIRKWGKMRWHFGHEAVDQIASENVTRE